MYEIKYATRMKEVIIFSFVFSVIMFQVGMLTQYSHPVLFYAQIAVNTVLIAALVIEAYARLVRRGVEIQKDSNVIRIHGDIIHADDIQFIRIQGCRSTAFSFKLKNKKRSSMRTTFKFMDAQCEGVREIVEWANVNGIEIIKVGPQSKLVGA